MAHSVEFQFQSAPFVQSKDPAMVVKVLTRTRWLLAAFSVACVVSVGMTWPVLRDGQSPILSVLTTVTTMLSLVSLFAVGSAKMNRLWVISVGALALGVIAPLVAALALRTDSASFPT
jgi:hypothetical protein